MESIVGIVRRLFDKGVTRPDVRISAFWAQQTTIAPGDELPVVGESHYQKALEWAAEGKTQDGCKLSLVTAELVREPFNRHDRNAVRVDVAGRTVGYVPRDTAPQTHRLIEQLWGRGQLASCRATLTGGWDRGWHDKGSIGIVLDVGYPPDVFDPERHGALPEGTRVSVTQEQHYQDALSALLGGRKEVDVVAELVITDHDPHRKKSGPTVQVCVDQRTVGYLTPKMSQRYIPLLRTAQSRGLPLTARTLVSRGDNKVEAFVRLFQEPARLRL